MIVVMVLVTLLYVRYMEHYSDLANFNSKPIVTSTDDDDGVPQFRHVLQPEVKT